MQYMDDVGSVVHESFMSVSWIIRGMFMNDLRKGFGMFTKYSEQVSDRELS